MKNIPESTVRAQSAATAEQRLESLILSARDVADQLAVLGYLNIDDLNGTSDQRGFSRLLDVLACSLDEAVIHALGQDDAPAEHSAPEPTPPAARPWTVADTLGAELAPGERRELCRRAADQGVSPEAYVLGLVGAAVTEAEVQP